jgi:protease IV
MNVKTLLLLFCLLCLPAFAADKPDILEVISAEGVVDDGMAQSITKRVEEINDNKRVKAVLLVVDSPGGGVLASAVIYEELSKLKVPVVGFCQNLCASGGMYILMAPPVKYIGVRTATISGSIGVIMHISRYNRLLDWARIDSETYKSGSLKDSGNPTRPIQPGEADDLQGTVTELADSFYALVAKSRGSKITAEHWKEIKTAKIFFGESGVKVGLVDQVMSREDAEKKAKELSGSKLVFTRDEIKKLSKDGDDHSSYEAPPAKTPSMFGDVPFLIETLKEIHSGSNVTIEYRMPYQM